MNLQLAVKDDEIWMIEVNPRASRTVPFVSKATGIPLADLGALAMVGERLNDLSLPCAESRIPQPQAVREADALAGVSPRPFRQKTAFARSAL